VLQGRIALSPEMASTLLAELAGHKTGPGCAPLASLTDRETEIFQFIGRARSNQEIARELHISAKTVETHRLNLMGKLKIRTRTELLRFALQYAERDAGCAGGA
jgi:two-component system response regulator NreC